MEPMEDPMGFYFREDRKVNEMKEVDAITEEKAIRSKSSSVSAASTTPSGGC